MDQDPCMVSLHVCRLGSNCCLGQSCHTWNSLRSISSSFCQTRKLNPVILGTIPSIAPWGPDTITAYALEDNELWLRHLLGLVVEVGVAFYVFVRSWGDNALTFIAIPVFIAGIIKYGERTWVLRSSSSKNFKASLLSAPNPGPNYAQFVEKGAGNKKMDKDSVALMVLPREDVNNASENYLLQADYLFQRFKYLFAGLILGYYERIDCHSIISKMESKEAFKLVEIELGFLYDVLYTKATIVYSWFGILLRCISSFASVSALVTFTVLIFGKHHQYSPTDIYITYSLLIGAIVLEVLALIILIDSDWTKLWLLKHKNGYSIKQDANIKRWSGTIAQYNLIKFCLKEKATTLVRVQKLLGIYEVLEKHQNVTWQDLGPELQELIFQELNEKSKRIEDNLYDISLCKTLLTHRGDYVIEKMGCLDLLKWSIIEVEFDHSLLLWHIATELCYFDDIKKSRGSSSLDGLNKHWKISRHLSDYMLYLLVMCPNMLPEGIGEIRYRDTCAEAIRFFRQRNETIGDNIDRGCSELFQVDTNMSLEEVKGDRSKSVLFYGCRLGKQLLSLESRQDWDCEKKWQMISKVWVEILSYAAIHCGWKDHAQQLRRGGELLTHVCLLMAHLGLSEQYQIQKQYIHHPKPRFFEDLLLEIYRDSRSECFLCLLHCILCIPHRCDDHLNFGSKD